MKEPWVPMVGKFIPVPEKSMHRPTWVIETEFSQPGKSVRHGFQPRRSLETLGTKSPQATAPVNPRYIPYAHCYFFFAVVVLVFRLNGYLNTEPNRVFGALGYQKWNPPKMEKMEDDFTFQLGNSYVPCEFSGMYLH